ncbi:MAG TPA: glycosyltransferase family 39 protein, partial [Thermoanaerobaculia bacterium]|nr:glycosyltransferase family 39 protein [Thermoanaerobaculia bacterium]
MQPDSCSILAKQSERAYGWLLALVLAVAFGARLWMALSASRFFDDHYVLNNVLPFLNGSLRPRQSYYGTLSWLPQALFLKVCDFLHSRTGLAALAVRGTQFEGFTLGAFRIMRMFVVFYALVSLWMIYLVGRRLFSPAVGLAAAAVLAAYPQHVRSSIQLKPDMMALMLTLITLYWTVEAVRSPRLSRFLRSGVGVGLAASAKYIGLASCLPLTVWSLWAGFRDRRLWAWLVLAGLASIVTFLVLNPFFGEVLYFGNRLVWYYGQKAQEEQSGHLDVWRGELDFLIYQHGWFLGVCLLLGLFLLVRRLRSREEDRAAAVLPLSLVLGYPVVHGLGMTLFYPHNLLPALGGTALVCACGMVRGGQWLLARPAAARPAAVTFLVWALPGAFLLTRPLAYTYGWLVPDNWVMAESTLRAELGSPEIRHVAYEPEDARLGLAAGWRRPALTAVPILAALPPAQLDLTDAELFPLSRAHGFQAAFYQGRRRRLAPECAREIHASPFRSQGEPLLLLLHPWTMAGDAVPVDLQRGAPGALVARLPGSVAAGEVLSFELIWPEDDETPVEKIRLGGRDLPLIYAGGRAQKTRYLTPRFRDAAGDAEIRLPASPQAHPRSFRLLLWRWSQGACGG